ncbi:unnamed protein product [Candida verbasci]|uniref:Protein kinase domain-containing protein n=1 Tax=Candida verbasci TaxID=1227364 RepID=A0A9W4XES3_9ASCO|nr:unnamed protein product [Candida verbasci]
MKGNSQTDPLFKEKELPVAPINQINPEINFNQQQSNNNLMLNGKSLDRKNCKKLSLDSAASTTSVIDNDQVLIDDSLYIKEPKSLRQKRQRAAPILNLPQSTPCTISTISNDSIIDKPISPSHSNGNIISQMINRPTATNRNSSSDSNKTLNISKRINVDDSINYQMSNLNLKNTQENNNNGGHGKNNHNRKSRQTIISSISPTKSTSSSPIHSSNTTSQVYLNFDNQSPISTTSSLKLNNADLITLKQLGSGNSGTVSKILHLPSQKIMAKKIIHIDSKSVIQTQIIRELRILHECQSPFIIEFYGAFLNNNNTIVICMEYCNCGSLDKILPLCDNRQFPLIVLKKLSFAILSGLTYLYETHKIIHRDIKPNNVLMTHKGEFKLCDFGVSRELTNSLAMADTFVGTSMYMSPERIQGLKYGIKSDVWSMGLMLIELASGLPVWLDEDEQDFSGSDSNRSFRGPEGILDLLQRIVNEKAPTLTNKINPVNSIPYDSKLCEFIDFCLIKNDQLRKSPWQLLQDNNGFLKGIEQGIYNKELKNWAKKIRKQSKEKK